jgi:hypothetical protein
MFSYVILWRKPCEYEAQVTCGWEFCVTMLLVPKLEHCCDDEPYKESLARWLLDNCPQDQELPVTEPATNE